MRTTLTIDEDVAIALERIQARDALTLKAAVNEALRRGLRSMDAEREVPRPTPPDPSVEQRRDADPHRQRGRSPGLGGRRGPEVILVDANLLVYAVDSSPG
jgi:Arc/MetJ family transcription regulator